MKVVLFVLFLSKFAMAADGSSGCGPGWYILKDNSLLSSALRSTTNGFLAPVATFGMTSGTSNCTKHKIVLKEKESLHFVTHNYFELKSQVAMGSGTHISALSQTMGCSGVNQQMNQSLKNSYSEIFDNSNNANPEKALTEIFKVILRNPELAKKCDFPQLV